VETEHIDRREAKGAGRPDGVFPEDLHARTEDQSEIMDRVDRAIQVHHACHPDRAHPDRAAEAGDLHTGCARPSPDCLRAA